jgi:TonB family protein
MNRTGKQGTLLQIPLIEERYGRSLLTSIGIHGIVLLMILFGGQLLPRPTVQLGSGPGGGIGGDISTVGVVDELSGGAGMVKPSILPKPPALLAEAPSNPSKAIPLPGTLDPKKKKPEPINPAKTAPVDPKSNIIPTIPEPGSGGIAGSSGGSGGGIGGGNGVSIGTGSGGFGNNWYAQAVENRISSSWIRPPEGIRVEIVYSFYIAANGNIYNIKKEKSSGNEQIDMTALRAINASNPLTPPPLEFRGKVIQFVAQFIYPPVP